MSYLDWHAGMKVVCVRQLRRLYNEDWQAKVPKEGQTYTLREIFIEDRGEGGGRPFVRLQEIVNALCDTEFGPYEPAYAASCFRPVEEKKTDISIFTAMLTGAKQTEKA